MLRLALDDSLRFCLSCSRVWRALEATAGCCVRHIRSQGEPPGPLKDVRSQKIKRGPEHFWEDVISWWIFFFFSFVLWGMHSAIKNNNHKGGVYRGVTLCQCPYAGLQTRVLNKLSQAGDTGNEECKIRYSGCSSETSN